MATWNTFRNPDRPPHSRSSSPFTSGKQGALSPTLVPECSARVEFGRRFFFFFIFASASLNLPSWSSGFRTVSFTLHTRDVLSTVTNVLKSCSLPVEHMSDLKLSSEKGSRRLEAAAPFYRPIRWDKSYYSFTGFRDPEEDLQRARTTEPTLRSSRSAFSISDKLVKQL